MYHPLRFLATASLALLPLLPLLPAQAEPMNLKLGLWEHSQSTQLDGMALPEAALKNMPPEQRARMEAMLRQGQGGGSGAMAVRSCLTQDKLGKPLVEPRDGDAARCTHTLVRSTRTVQEISFRCSQPEESAGTMRLEAQSPERYKGTLTMNSARGKVTMQMEGRWISADCGKPAR